eukprot:9958204-Karenia_brevis.AAC.1
MSSPSTFSSNVPHTKRICRRLEPGTYQDTCTLTNTPPGQVVLESESQIELPSLLTKPAHSPSLRQGGP